MNYKRIKIRKTMQKMEEEFNKDIEILKKKKAEILEMKSSISQIKTQLKALPIDLIKLKTKYQRLEIR
jgi:hypothetical protein